MEMMLWKKLSHSRGGRIRTQAPLQQPVRGQQSLVQSCLEQSPKARGFSKAEFMIQSHTR